MAQLLRYRYQKDCQTINTVIKKIAFRVRKSFRLRRNEVFMCVRPEDLVGASSRILLSIQNVTPDNVHRVAEFRDEAKVSSFRRFIDQAQIGVYAIAGSKVVGHAWAIIAG